jgi:hypothetical protein
MKTLMCAAIVGLMALGVFTASIAHADDMDGPFLAALQRGGIQYQDPGAMVTQGHLVCKSLTSGGFSYAETVYGMAKQSGSTVSAENAFAAIAVGYLCPAQAPLVMPAQSQLPPDARIDFSDPST